MAIVGRKYRLGNFCLYSIKFGFDFFDPAVLTSKMECEFFSFFF